MTNPEFYSQVALKFGGYTSNAQRTKIFRTVDPEALFGETVTALGGGTAHLLDVGCADGLNVLAVAPAYRQVTAIDMAAEMLDAARANQLRAGPGPTEVSFQQRDAEHTGLPDAAFDVISSRRGPLFADEFWRLLKPGGSLVYLGIGERDVQDIKEVFGRGQQYGQWGTSILETEQLRLEKQGFLTVRAEDIWFDEYFHSRADLCRFLEVVPIFEEFDAERDAGSLDRFISRAQTERGIHFARHWVLLTVRKPDRAAHAMP
ncbi:class I SAM-dependent methyltransferase [Streptomyces iconiensis]|uniref:Class I SAM-dependent methyltransferase n=1 Tax=Streptomyces iconiensis TaxID=1384038 RepID=A0ABT7A0D6_9ACTN|nr:class I SAM-dependent methyltransferase [Streptomyces iconiensis]MDJ1134785.1 class I SAM-dependent methyltransferase [Streptomyces iconiensis]